MDTDAELTARIAEIVRELIADSGHSNKALAEATGIPRVTFIRKLTGHPKSPFTPGELALLAPFLGLPPSAIVARAEASLGRAA